MKSYPTKTKVKHQCAGCKKRIVKRSNAIKCLVTYSGIGISRAIWEYFHDEKCKKLFTDGLK